MANIPNCQQARGDMKIMSTRPSAPRPRSVLRPDIPRPRPKPSESGLEWPSRTRRGLEANISVADSMTACSIVP